MRRTRSPCCARAPSGHAAAPSEPPESAMRLPYAVPIRHPSAAQALRRVVRLAGTGKG